MNEWASTLLGSGLVGTPILTLVLTGRLIPVWVVRKQVESLEKSQAEAKAALEKSHGEALTALQLSHQRELTSQAQAHADALDVRDREAARQQESLTYERGAKDVERNRSDALADRLASVAAESGQAQLKLVSALREAAGGHDAG